LEACLCFSNDAGIQTLNADHRGKQTATNVLSFATFDDEDLVIPPGGPVPLGDIVMALETIAGEAAAAGLPLRHHVQHMIAHGVLHLLGYDHEHDDDATVMEDLERDILKSLGVADPYASSEQIAS